MILGNLSHRDHHFWVNHAISWQIVNLKCGHLDRILSTMNYDIVRSRWFNLLKPNPPPPKTVIAWVFTATQSFLLERWTSEFPAAYATFSACATLKKNNQTKVFSRCKKPRCVFASWVYSGTSWGGELVDLAIPNHQASASFEPSQFFCT